MNFLVSLRRTRDIGVRWFMAIRGIYVASRQGSVEVTWTLTQRSAFRPVAKRRLPNTGELVREEQSQHLDGQAPLASWLCFTPAALKPC